MEEEEEEGEEEEKHLLATRRRREGRCRVGRLGQRSWPPVDRSYNNNKIERRRKI